MTALEACAQAFENGRRQGDAEGYARGKAEAVKHGRWIMKETMIRSPFAKNAYCSVCLEETSDAHNYCPNCGTRMDGDGDA